MKPDEMFTKDELAFFAENESWQAREDYLWEKDEARRAEQRQRLLDYEAEELFLQERQYALERHCEVTAVAS